VGRQHGRVHEHPGRSHCLCAPCSDPPPPVPHLFYAVNGILQVLWCAYSPDGAFLVSSACDATVRMWDATSGKQLRVLEGHTDHVRYPRSCVDLEFDLWGMCGLQVWCCAFSPRGDRIVSGSRDETLRIWDTSTGNCVKELRGHTNSVWIAFFLIYQVVWMRTKCHRCLVAHIPLTGA